jgi:predicted methyltransferase
MALPFRPALALFLVLAGCSGASSPPEPATPEPAPAKAPSPPGPSDEGGALAAIRAAVEAPDRAEADRALDAGRKPAETLAFFRIAPGQRVAELFAGGGYTAEVLARAVGPGGKVYGQNSKMILERFAEGPWAERLRKPVMANVARADRDFNDPLPPDAKGLDAVLFLLSYHDTVWMGVDRAAMNRAIFAALKPGGVYGITDHHAKAGRGLEDVQTLHRIEKDVLVKEVLAAGFKLEAESNLLANPADPRDWSASPRTAGERRGTSDRFTLRFVKP